MAKRSNFVFEILEDVIIEILVRLPLKSLLRAKSVCKIWYVLIKSPSFISMHHKFNLGRVPNLVMYTAPQFKQQTNIHNHVFTIHPSDKSASADLRILENTDNYVKFASGSCNGIVCYYDDNKKIYLCNPTTREFKQLPPTSFKQGTTDEKFYQLGIAFGFGSRNIYDFKVCRIFVARKEGSNRPTHKAFGAEMFTLSSNSWKQLHWGLNDRVRFINGSDGSFCANSFHFLAVHCKSLVRTVVCCDIHTERFRTMELPSTKGGIFIHLMAHPNFLSVLCNKFPEFRDNTAMEVWIMKDYGVVASWTKLYSFGQYAEPRFFWTENDALVTELETSDLVLCHHDSLNCEPLEIDGYNKRSQFLVYQETLVSIQGRILNHQKFLV